VTRSQQLGMQQKVVSESLGRRPITLTLDTYWHLASGMDVAAERLAVMLAPKH
jgi:hypothetical protein